MNIKEIEKYEECYRCGKADDTVSFAPDPFANEFNDDDTNVYQCEDCRGKSALDI